MVPIFNITSPNLVASGSRDSSLRLAEANFVAVKHNRARISSDVTIMNFNSAILDPQRVSRIGLCG